MRTWSPKGHTPVLEFNFNWKKLSAIAGLSWWNFYFRLYPGAIKTEQVIDFLKHLQRIRLRNYATKHLLAQQHTIMLRPKSTAGF